MRSGGVSGDAEWGLTNTVAAFELSTWRRSDWKEMGPRIDTVTTKSFETSSHILIDSGISAHARPKTSKKRRKKSSFLAADRNVSFRGNRVEMPIRNEQSVSHLPSIVKVGRLTGTGLSSSQAPNRTTDTLCRNHKGCRWTKRALSA